MANGNPTYIYTDNYIYIYMFLGFIVLIEMMRSGYKEQGLYIKWNKFLCWALASSSAAARSVIIFKI